MGTMSNRTIRGSLLRREVEEALGLAAEFRRGILRTIAPDDRIKLLEALFVDFFVEQWRVLLKWAALTGQSSQLDTGYIAQHVASIVLGEPGQGFKGKGLDLLDGTEAKSAAILSGVDRPRWNHNLGTIAQDRKRAAKGLRTTSDEYLAAPNVFYLLFDRVVDEEDEALVLRVRAWCIDGQEDKAWRDLLTRYIAQRTANQYNLQLHPPVGYDDDLVVNTLGNLDFTNVKLLEARIFGLADPEDFSIKWMQKPSFPIRPVRGRSVSLPYKRDRRRASRLAVAADVMPDLAVLSELLPELGADRIEQLAATLQRESTLAAVEESGGEEGIE